PGRCGANRRGAPAHPWHAAERGRDGPRDLARARDWRGDLGGRRSRRARARVGRAVGHLGATAAGSGRARALVARVGGARYSRPACSLDEPRRAQRPVHRPGTREFFPLVPGGNRAFIVPWFVGRARRTNPSTPASTAEGVSVVPSTLRSSPRPARTVRPAVAAALT